MSQLKLPTGCTTTTTKDECYTHTTTPPKGEKQLTVAWGGYGEKNLTDKKNFYGKKLISKELFDKVLKLNRIKHFFKRTALVVTFAISTNRPLGVS